MVRACRVIAIVSALCGAALPAQNLLANPDFDQDAADWLLFCGTSFEWVVDDESGCPGSGGAHVVGSDCLGLQGAGIAACVQVGSLQTVWASARVRPNVGFGVLAIRFYDNPDCSEPFASQEIGPTVPANGDWLTVNFDAVSIPAGTQSALVGFGGAAPAPGIESEVDYAYFGARPLVFRDDFEGDDGLAPPACRWSATAP